jgi:predicted nucleotidyltransferase
MQRSEAIAKLKQHEAELKRLGVEHLYLFGSTARDEAGEIPMLICFLIIPRIARAF